MKRNNLKPSAKASSTEQNSEGARALDKQLSLKNHELQELNTRLKQEVIARKQVEEALQKNETNYRNLIENSSDIIARFDKDLRYTFINKTVESTFGFSREQAIGRTYGELSDEDSLIGESKMKLKEVFNTGVGRSCFIYLPTAEGLRCFYCTLQPEFNSAGEVEAVSSIGHDLTILALKEQMLNHVFDNTKLGITALIAVRDEQQRIVNFKWVLVNKRAETILALNASQLLNNELLRIFPGVKITGMFDLMVQAVEENKTYSQSVYYNHEHLDAWYDLLISKLDDGVMLSFIDISEYRQLALMLHKTNADLQREALERKEAQEQLSHEHELLERIIENSIDCICALDASGKITAWNKKMENYSGMQRTLALGKPIYEVFPEAGNCKVDKFIQRLLNGKAGQLKTMPFKRQLGFYDLNLVPTFNSDKVQSGGIIFLHDVTESIELKEITIKHRLAQQKQHLQVALQTQEEERKRIAEALHNGLGQLLYGIKLHFEQLDSTNTPSTHVKALLEEAIQETRTIAFELMPSILQDFGLEVTLRELCQKLSKAHVSIALAVYDASARFDPEIEIAAYRMIQELINNSLKHSEATHVRIEVCEAKSSLYLQVSDNGKGLDKTMLKKEKGIGLRSIKKRLKLMGGKLRIEVNTIQGTRIRLKLPL
ncbi:PAS domain-containing protein [Pontibacter oryzae]|uniref:histidine kinase n=1 Tax=Pontibacter oryzae TaxID=2304593 RepID=A0A399SHF0_9BACT|nr:PAS domain-containing protein [Pontibacter oryzae]RIJ42434.1 PAS domain S-box protein [Pontibacter oryzae]